MSLHLKIKEAQDKKPPQWEPCNQCGWCCLTEVCPTGIAITASEVIPCKLLVEKDGKHLCSVADMLGKIIGIGTGCDAATQQEQLEKINEETDK